MINEAELSSKGNITPKFSAVAEKSAINHPVVMSAAALKEKGEVEIKANAESQSVGGNLALVAHLSHELRTSVTGIDGNTHVMRSCNNDMKSCNDEMTLLMAQLGQIPIEEFQKKMAEIQKKMAKSIARSDKALNTVDICASHQKGLVNNVLDLSKLEAGKSELIITEMDPKKIVNEAIAILEPKSTEKNLKVSFDCLEDIKLVEGDAGKLREILLNLLSNAIKFTAPGKNIAITLRKSMSNETHTTFELAVEDEGLGMTEAEKAELFKAYSQPIQQSKKQVGTGLGLYLSAEFVKLMHGTMKVDSLKNKGSKFTFTIQCKNLAQIPRPSSPLVFSNLRVNTSNGERSIIEGETVNQQLLQLYFAEKGATGKKTESLVKKAAELGSTPPHAKKEGVKGECLIVDDNSINRQLLRGFLRGKGFSCSFATNGKEAVEACANKKYDIILMDITMPIMGGIEATRIIRQNEKLENSPSHKQPTTIIAMPADTLDKDLLEKVISCGMNDAITKPFNWPIVLAKLEKLFPSTPVSKHTSAIEGNQPPSPMSLSTQVCLDATSHIDPSSPPVLAN